MTKDDISFRPIVEEEFIYKEKKKIPLRQI